MPDSIIDRRETFGTIGDGIAGIAFDHPAGLRWWLAFAVAMGLTGMLAVSLFFVLYDGTGVWGNNNPVVWALDIVSYDWWIGIASGGLLVSAALMLLGAEWRGALNRIAETMALIATAAAGLYPIVHLGRPWFFYWNLPYPNTFQLWPQVRSPLFWDAVDIVSYLLTCLVFWYIGLLPDLATLRDRAIERAQVAANRDHREVHVLRAQLYGIAALGWRGSAGHWHRWSQAHRLIGLFGIILVVSLQSGAAVMFAGSVEPGWHDALLPVSFLASAVLSGVGMVAVLSVVLRSVFGLQPLITARHFELLACLLLAAGTVSLYCFVTSHVSTSLSGSDYDRAAEARTFAGPNAWSTWLMMGAALLPVHVFWVPALRRSAAALLIVGALATVGVWADHVMVIVLTLQHDYLPSAAHDYSIDVVELTTFLGTGGLFLLLLLLFTRYLPVVSIAETRRLLQARLLG